LSHLPARRPDFFDLPFQLRRTFVHFGKTIVVGRPDVIEFVEAFHSNASDRHQNLFNPRKYLDYFVQWVKWRLDLRSRI
jgi:hypothetical protein